VPAYPGKAVEILALGRMELVEHLLVLRRKFRVGRCGTLGFERRFQLVAGLFVIGNDHLGRHFDAGLVGILLCQFTGLAVERSILETSAAMDSSPPWVISAFASSVILSVTARWSRLSVVG
jgi:hypothetical protein